MGNRLSAVFAGAGPGDLAPVCRSEAVTGAEIRYAIRVEGCRTLEDLRDIGNTVIVVEHDEETMREADHLIDLGPGGGTSGGRITATGTPDEIAADADSITGRYL